jgi:hypothetical protein
MEAAASSELVSVSDVIRRAVLRDLRSRGLFKSEVVAAWYFRQTNGLAT